MATKGTIDILQASLAGGEVSPSIFPRVDLDKFKSSLRTCRNYIVHAQGGVSNRCGFEYIAAAKYSGSMCVTHEFIFNQTQAYAIEFGHKYIRFYTDGEQVMSSGSAYEVISPYLVGDLNDLRFEGSADVIFITHPSYKQRTLSRFGATDWRLETIDYTDGPFMPENTDESVSLAVSATTGSGVTLTLSGGTTVNANMMALLHGNGVDASTTITDTRALRTWTAAGNAQIDTAQSKFGGASILLDGTGDYVTTPDSADFNFGTGDFTVGYWMRFNNLNSGSFSGLWSQYADANNYIIFYHQNGASLGLSVKVAGVEIIGFNWTWTPIVNTWYNVELVRSGSNFNVRIDGVSIGSTGVSATAMPDIAAAFDLGRATISGSVYYINGWVDEFEILKGEARHTEDYTPQIAEYSTLVTTAQDFTFDSLHVGALFKLTHYVGNQAVTAALGSATTSGSIRCFTTWRLITHGTWTGTLKIQKSSDGGTTWTDLRLFSSVNDFNANTSGTEDIETNPEPFLIRLNMSSYTSGTCNADLTADPFYQDGIAQATAYVSPVQLTVTMLTDAASTANTTSWAEGSWSDYRGYPSVSRFYQDRLAYAATPSEPQTIWMTETGNYYSFIRHSTLLDTDGITINLPSRQVNIINGLLSFKKLLAFTASSVWSIGPISGSALTPTTVTTDIEEYSGSSGISPAVIGTEAIYNQQGNEIIRNIGFQLNIDGYTGSEANILAYHLFQGYTITKMAYQKNPNSILWCLRSDGVLLALTYNQEQQVVAWTHHDTDGTIESICVIPGSVSDELWVSVSRNNGRYIERMQGRKQFDLTGHVFLDSYITQEDSTLVISAGSHLANQTVGIIADGVVLSQQVASASGTLTMSATYDLVYAGLPYNADFQTLNIEAPLKTGTIQGDKVKIGNITLRLLNSRAGAYIGPNENKLYEAFTYDELNRANFLCNGTTLGVTSNFSADVRIPLGGEYSNGGSFFLRHPTPVPLSIGSLIPEVSIGGASS